MHLVMEVPQDSGMATLRSTTPVLASLDIAKTIEFYVSELGFEKVYGEQKQYGVVSRDDISIHFWACSDPEIAKATSCRIQTEGIEEMYADLSSRGVVHAKATLEDKPWGSREFGIVDRDGNLLVFFEPLEG